jgi:hypothetical protein
MSRSVILVISFALFGCKESYAPSPQGPSDDPPTKAAGSLVDKPGPKPAAPIATGTVVPPSNPPIRSKPAQPSVADAPTKVAPSQTSSVTVAGLTFQPAEGWIREQPRSRMRLAQFRLPPTAGDSRPGVMTVIAAGGDLDANVKRWEGQFQGGPQSKRVAQEVGGKSVTRVEIEGTFMFKARPMAPGPGTPQPGTLLLGAVAKVGQTQLFFKAWGPKPTMERWRAGFDAMVASFTWGT